VSSIEKSGEALTGSYQDDLLQPLAAKSWQELKAAAKKDGLGMSLVSGYRSPKSQRDLFTERLYSTGVTDKQISAGTPDNSVNATLSMTAVPGYSRHHTGYTIDIHCDDGLAFGVSTCNQWITKDNYANAKKYGWIPSYPPGAGEQGPEPEAWEYVWVGTDVLYE
jgi:D-alanyl-D-alanine carboxypeptidase